jgi:hypothetical protein
MMMFERHVEERQMHSYGSRDECGGAYACGAQQATTANGGYVGYAPFKTLGPNVAEVTYTQSVTHTVHSYIPGAYGSCEEAAAAYLTMQAGLRGSPEVDMAAAADLQTSVADTGMSEAAASMSPEVVKSLGAAIAQALGLAAAQNGGSAGVMYPVIRYE